MTTFTRGMGALWRWQSPTWLDEAPTLRLVDADAVEHLPALAPVVPAPLPRNAAAEVVAVRPDRRTLTLAADLDEPFEGAGERGDAWLLDTGGSLHQVKVGTRTSPREIRLTDGVHLAIAPTAERPALLQWAGYEVALDADHLGVEGRTEWSVAFAGRGVSGPDTGVWRVVRRFDTGLDLAEFYDDFPEYLREQLRRGDHRRKIESVRQKLEGKLRVSLRPRDETVVTDGRQFLRCHKLWTAAELEVGPERIEMRRQLLREGDEAYNEALQALLVDLDGDGRTDEQPFSPRGAGFRGRVPTRRLFTIRGH